MRNKATIKDVAKIANVSIATVSYVLNNNPNKSISAKTKRRVFEAAKQLGYISNSAARTLQSSRTNCIGVVIYQTLTLQRHAQVLQGMINALREKSYSILHCSPKIMEHGYPEYLSAVFSHKVDGVVYLGADSSTLDSDVENIVVEQRVPFVACDCETNRNISSVAIDYFKGAYDMARHFIKEKGVSNIFYFRPDIDNKQEREREQGIRRAVFECSDIQLDVNFFNFDHTRLLDDYYISSLKSKIDEFDSNSGIICSWSGLDQLTLLVLKEEGIDIPVATLAQGCLSPALFPNLSYSYLPNLLIGKTCAELVLRLLEDESDIRHEIVQPSLSPIINMAPSYS